MKSADLFRAFADPIAFLGRDTLHCSLEGLAETDEPLTEGP